jgi:hypothetical protein
MAWIIPRISSFQVGGPSSLAWSGVVVPWYGLYGSPAICHWRESILSRVLGRNQCPQYPGYITVTIAPEPSVEVVVGASYSTVGRIGTHMVLWALLRDLAEILYAQSAHNLDWESHGDAHCVAPEAASDVKAQAKAKFHMY